MKIKHLFLAAAALVVGFSSCSKDDGGKDGSSEKNIYIKIEKPTLTRADVGEDYEGKTSEISYGHLYFANADGDVKRYIRVTNNSVTGTISPALLQKGTVIESLSGDVSMVYFFANMFGENSKAISKISDLDAEAVTLASQYDLETYGIKNAVLKGSGPIRPSSSPDYQWEAIFTVSPMIMRIETAKTSSHATEGPTTAQLEGIYINNYHPDLTVANDLPYTGVINHLQDYEKYLRVSDGGAYLDSDERHLFDDDKTATLRAITAKGGSISAVNGAWAYNVFATGEPHIVFHFSNVRDENGVLYDNPVTGNNDAYLTVTRFVDAGTDDAVDIQGGYIYRIDDLVFKFSDLGETPEVKTKKDVFVKITVMPWKVRNVDGKFD